MHSRNLLQTFLVSGGDPMQSGPHYWILIPISASILRTIRSWMPASGANRASWYRFPFVPFDIWENTYLSLWLHRRSMLWEQFILLSATTTVRSMLYFFLNPSKISFSMSESLMFLQKTSKHTGIPLSFMNSPICMIGVRWHGTQRAWRIYLWELEQYQGVNLFFQLIERRYEKTSMVFNSNKTFYQWYEVFSCNFRSALTVESVGKDEWGYLLGLVKMTVWKTVRMGKIR